MKGPISKIIIILLLAFAICQLVYMTSGIGLKKYNIHKNDRLTELFLANTRYDLLFIGSSRTHTGINPLIIDSITNLHSYNGGVEGGNLLEFNMTFNAFLLNHPKPKFLVLTLDLASFNLERKFFNYTQYFPFLKNRIIDETLNKNDHNTFFPKILPFLELTDYDDFTRNNCVKGLMGSNEIAPGESQYKGYLTNTMNIINTGTAAADKLHTEIISDESAMYLQSIIDTCKAKNINLIFTYAPEYKKELQKHTSNSRQIMDLINNFAKENNILFLRHDNLEICTDFKLFANIGHLNRIGADRYSRILGLELKSLK